MSDAWSAFIPAPAAADAPPPPPPPDPNGPAVQSAAQPDAWAAFSPQAGAPVTVAGPRAPAIIIPKNAADAFRGIVNADTYQPYNDAQEAAYADGFKRGVFDPNAPAGSAKLPLGQTDPADLPKPGDYYMGLDGKVQQRPPDSWLNTAGRIALEAGGALNPELAQIAAAAPEDPRLEAAKSGLMSGVLLGGKNETMSTLDAVPKFVSGGMDAALPAFRTDLANRDRADAQLTRDFPLVHNGAAVAGAVGGGLVMPEAELGLGGRLALNSAIGGVGGFLSTDGTLADRAKGAGYGALGGAVLGEVLPRLLGAIPRTVGASDTDAVNMALKPYGVTVDQLPQDGQDYVASMLRKGAQPDDIATAVAAKSLPVPVRLTLGQVTGLPEDQQAYNMALRGTRGNVAAGRAQDFARGQQGDLRGNVQTIATNLAGGEPPTIGQGAMGISEDLNNLYTGKKVAVDAAYDAARADPSATVLPAYDAQAIAGNARARFQADFDPLNVPTVARELDRLDNISTGDVNLKDLFNSRARLSNLSASNNPYEAKAAGSVVKQMDAGINDAITADLFHGDPASVDKWKTAIASRADMGQLFDQGDLVDKLTQRTGTGGQRRLVVDPGDAANYILGRSNLGFVGKQNLYTDLDKVKSLVSPASWNALRSEVFQRIAQSGEGGLENGFQQFSGANFTKAWNTANTKDSRLMQTLFTPEERQQIGQFSTVAAKVTSPVKGGDNPSGTAAWLMAAGKKGAAGLLSGLKAVPVVDALPHAIEDMTQRLATARALSGKPRITPSPSIPLLPSRVGAFGGGMAADPGSR